VHGHAGLVLDEVAVQQALRDVEGAGGALGREDAGAGCAEDVARRRVECEARGGPVVADGVPLCEVGEVAAVEEFLCVMLVRGDARERVVEGCTVCEAALGSETLCGGCTTLSGAGAESDGLGGAGTFGEAACAGPFMEVAHGDFAG